MESLPDHSWRKYLFTGEYHQVLDPPHVTDTDMVWAACSSGGVRELWATESDPEGVPRCVHCLVLVGGQATARRTRQVAARRAQTPEAFRALNTDGPRKNATSARLDRPDLQPQRRQITSEEEPLVRRPEQGDGDIRVDHWERAGDGDAGASDSATQD